ncbi:MAG: NAD(P)-dependent alcohol dehydrogenase [Anaerolineae bacterium]|jgi:NADPH:quinone reductase-like Zn-dependent oxidoreductase|nr:NAD(P)-dependent alcohol dehydrogenase [Anaerolineae bacterium]
MKAMIYTEYGSPDQLRLAEMPQPIPKADEVLVKIHATSVNSADVRLMRGQPFMIRLAGYGLFKPKYPILGGDIAGQVVQVGRDVTTFQPGDRVYGDVSNCGLGGFAEYAAVPESALAPMPKGLTFEEAAALPLAGITALQAVQKAKLQAGERVAINGASGGVGTFAVQIARTFGADVTAITSASKLNMLLELGATAVIDYAREDFTTHTGQYDAILAINGYHPLRHYARALKPNGRYIMVGGTDGQIFEALLLAPLIPKPDGKCLTLVTAKSTRESLQTLSGLVERGELKPVIERCYPLMALADALRFLEAGHARGKVVITL